MMQNEPMQNKTISLIHIGIIGKEHLFLRKLDAHTYTWFEEKPDGTEKATSVSAPNIEEALRLAHREWKSKGFRTMRCGFRFTLPERDEHGLNALFFQMCASYNSMNGVYFDEELGSNCIVNNAPLETLRLYNRLKQQASSSS